MNYSINGYRNNSPDRNRSHNVIPGNIISMANVSQQLRLVPIVNGQPDYNRSIVAKPNQEDIQFEQDVEAVLEIPYAQTGTLNPQVFQGLFNPTDNLNTALNYSLGLQGNSYNENAMSTFQNPYVNKQSQTNLPSATQKNIPDPGRFIQQQAPPAIQSNIPSQGAFIQQQAPTQSDILEGRRLSNQNFLSQANALGVNLGVDPNLAQQQEAINVTQTKQQKKPMQNSLSGFNPYGAWNMENSAMMLGRSIQDKSVLGTVASSGKLLLSGFRNAASGAGLRKVEQEAKTEYENDLDRAERTQGWRFLQKGGLTGEMLTGNFIEGDKDHSNPNSEVEKGEFVQTPDGNSMEVLGKRHSEGGELVNLPANTKVVSDYLKIGSDLSTMFKKDYNLNVKSGSTFATVLDKYKQKIGLTELIEEEAELMQKVVDQEKVEFDGTREINLQVLSEKLQEIKPRKTELEDKFNTFTNLVYEKQEQTKKPGESNFEKQEGGEITEPPIGNTEEQVLPEQQQPQGNQIEQLILQYAQMTGAQPEELIQQLQQLDENQLQEAIGQIIQVVQQAQAQSQVETTPQSSESIVDEESAPEMKKGGEIPKYQKAGEVTPTEFNNFLADHSNNPPYAYGDLPAQRSALEPLLTNAGIQFANTDLTTQQSQDQFAGQYQGYLNKNYPGLTKHYSSQVTPTQQGLQTALNNGLVTEEQLKNLGVKVQNGSVLKGSKGIVPKDNEQKVVSLITKAGEKNSEGYQKYVDSNFVDNRWYYRTPTIKTVSFGSEADRDAYLKKGDYQVVEDKEGNKIYYSGKQGVYFNTKVGSKPNAEEKNDSSETTATTASSDIDKMNLQGANRAVQSSLPLLPPDQSNLPPTYQTTSLRSIGSVQANPIVISPEATIRELNRQYTTASNLASETNPYTAGALTANLQAQTNDAINQAYTQANIANAQDRRNVENINEERIQARDLANNQYLGKYEAEQIAGQGNLQNELRSYYDNRNRQNLVNWNLTNEQNAYNSILQHFQISGNGIDSNGQPQYLMTNNQMIANPNYNRTQETITKTTPDGKTTTINKTKSAPKKQKGGRLTKEELKKWLK